MRKTFFLLGVCFISSISAQVKKEEKFIENNNYVSTSNAGILMQKYYRETKAVIYSHEKDLGEENFNKMLIFNQKEYWEATSDKFWRDDLSKVDKESAKIVYLSKLTSRLENYRLDVLEKLNDILEEKK
ncbi:hypothetical protein H9Q08_10055 [Chryseobacterium sp. PS-8]|uniref:Uncharacterized protein n=1 Tax=Chryseobacterium indicum TaxID=2766954 RepID=A0ABS9C500_9FLAO|nr:hypothetical protein [Chryseobacterium sp. PS-8]MCF2219651.1 hypothetical protein [Chryseobacterium sp. PS-8]